MGRLFDSLVSTFDGFADQVRDLYSKKVSNFLLFFKVSYLPRIVMLSDWENPED